MLEEKIKTLKNYIETSNNIVIFTGAGVSTDSGIKDFRSKDGLYNEVYDYPPEKILSHTFFINNTNEFYKFYKDKLDCRKALPNMSHKYFYKLEQNNKLNMIITQNIDGLHYKAGNKKVIELHGSIYRNYCMKCNKFYNEEIIFNNNNNICKCKCKGIIKPDVVLYEETLDDNNINRSIKAIKEADLLLIVGTSLSVYPASGLINYYKGNKLVIINKDTTKIDNYANIVINENASKIFEKLI